MPRSLLLGAALAALMTTGCGSTTYSNGGSSASQAGTSSATPAQFAAQADAICTTLHTQQGQLRARLIGLERLPTARQARKAGGAIARESVTLARAAEVKLQALPRPVADAATIEHLLAGYREETGYALRIAEAIAHEYPRGQEAAARGLKRAVTVDRGLAVGLGLRACAESE